MAGPEAERQLCAVRWLTIILIGAHHKVLPVPILKILVELLS